MKRLSITFLLVSALASPAMAGQLLMQSGPYQGTLGGEFTFKVIDASGGFSLAGAGYAEGVTKNIAGFPTSFQTFCLETNEVIKSGFTYNAALSSSATLGGVGGATSGSDPVSQGTGWLYAKFAVGTLVPYAYGGTAAERQASADALQRTIWWLENESSDLAPGTVYDALLIAQFGSLANARLDGIGANYGVFAANLTADLCNGAVRGPNCQSILFRVPDGGATLMLLGGALMGITALRRKIRR